MIASNRIGIAEQRTRVGSLAEQRMKKSFILLGKSPTLVERHGRLTEFSLARDERRVS